MIPENEIIEGCNVLFNEQLFSVKWKQTKGVIIRPINNIGFIETAYDAVHPIPLTADILQSLGFSETGTDSFSYKSADNNMYEVFLSGQQNIKLHLNGENLTVSNLNVHLLQKEIFITSKESCSLKAVNEG